MPQRPSALCSSCFLLCASLTPTCLLFPRLVYRLTPQMLGKLLEWRHLQREEQRERTTLPSAVESPTVPTPGAMIREEAGEAEEGEEEEKEEEEEDMGCTEEEMLDLLAERAHDTHAFARSKLMQTW